MKKDTHTYTHKYTMREWKEPIITFKLRTLTSSALLNGSHGWLQKVILSGTSNVQIPKTKKNSGQTLCDTTQ